MGKKVLYGVGAVLAIVVLAFAYYAISPIFIHIKADDALPGEAGQGAELPKAPLEGSTDAGMPVEEPGAQGSTQPATEGSLPAEVIGTTGHPASGTARIVSAEGKQYVRYENFSTLNGPDIYVYLANDLDAKDFVNLGKVRATEGNINYEIPSGVDASQYRYVLTWCKTFAVLFNYADLASAR